MNMLERPDEEIKRRTKVVRIFPDARSCLRLVRALCAETRGSWMEDGVRYLDMDLLQEQRWAADPGMAKAGDGNVISWLRYRRSTEKNDFLLREEERPGPPGERTNGGPKSSIEMLKATVLVLNLWKLP